MVGRLQVLIPGRPALRRLLYAVGFAGVAALAFVCGRQGVLSQARATPPVGDPFLAQLPLTPAASNSDYGRRVVAYIYNNVPITREDLGEYLIARMGADRVEFLVNQRIIERACQAKGVQVTDAEIDAQLRDEVQALGITVADFENKLLKRFNKTLYEYREDKIRPQLAMAKFCRDHVTVTGDDLKRAFEAKYGDKVECRMIVFGPTEQKRAYDVFAKVRDNDAEFDRECRAQSFIPVLGGKNGVVPPIHRHFGDPRIEKEAFGLKPGEVSSVIELIDKSFVILKCVKHIPADTTKTMDEERPKLYKEVFDQKLALLVPQEFQELRKQATPVVYLRKQVTQEDLERTTQKLLNPTGAPAPPTASTAPPSAPPMVNGPAVQEMPALPASSGPKAAAPRGN
jgi:hypothetical protein